MELTCHQTQDFNTDETISYNLWFIDEIVVSIKVTLTDYSTPFETILSAKWKDLWDWKDLEGKQVKENKKFVRTWRNQ